MRAVTPDPLDLESESIDGSRPMFDRVMGKRRAVFDRSCPRIGTGSGVGRIPRHINHFSEAGSEAARSARVGLTYRIPDVFVGMGLSDFFGWFGRSKFALFGCSMWMNTHFFSEFTDARLQEDAGRGSQA